MEEEKYIGFIKYEGPLVQDGLMDAKKQAQALLGLDFALRYIIGKQAPSLRNLEFEIPVRIKKGSWEALIPDTVAGWSQAGIGIIATAYLTKAAGKMAEKDFADFGFTDLFIKAFDGIKWFAKIGKHMGDLTIRSFEHVKFSDDNTLIGIPNAEGKYLYIPKNILDLYISCDPKLLEMLALNIEDDRKLTIGTVSNGEIDEISIYRNEKAIFCLDDSELDEDILFPELVHGDDVILEGEVTRENKITNSMGFKYKEHVLTAYPETRSIIPYKSLLFLKCRLHGVVNRIDEKGHIAARRPKLIFSYLEPLETDEVYDLFN